MSVNYQSIKVNERDTVAELVLSRPPLNVMNIAMMKEMNSALSRLQHYPSAKLLLIRAEGKAFSAGVDIADHTNDKVADMMREFNEIFALLHGFTIPTLAVVDGAALGGGCELVIACDMVVASERAKLGQPEINVGVFPPIAAALLPRLVGRNRAMEWLMTGDAIPAAEALRIGLINKMFPVEGFDASVNEFVSKFTRQSRIILEMTKQAVDGGLFRPTMEAIRQAEALYMGEMMKTEDAQEGLKAFLEKRQPLWKNT
jgi:cyclohexa-1,5-dienecarbonyl-CoA hydratase